MVALFVGLGVWQLQRRAEKHALIAALTERLAAAPAPLPPPSQWRALDAGEGRIPPRQFQRDLRPASPMPWSIAPARPCARIFPDPAPGLSCRRGCPAGEIVVVNAGFVPEHDAGPCVEDRAAAPLLTDRPVMLTGYIRFPESAGLLTPAESLAKRLWFDAGSSSRWRSALVGPGRDGRAILRRSRDAGARERHPEARPAAGAFEGRPHAIRHHLVFAGRGGGDRVSRVAERSAATFSVPRVRLPTTGRVADCDVPCAISFTFISCVRRTGSC